jgi:hypothetical protein
MAGTSGPVKGGTPGHPINQTEGFGMYAQGGYYISDWKLQPWASAEYWNATDAFGSWRAYRLGLTYFVRGYNANVKLGYERVETAHEIGSSRAENSGRDHIDTLVLGLYLNF